MDAITPLERWLEAAEACRPTCMNVAEFDELTARQRARLGRNTPMKTEEPAMNPADHVRLVGSIVTNLQALETHLRYFIVKSSGQEVAFPKEGDKDVTENYLTNYVSLGELIKTFNAVLSADERMFLVDESVVVVRDAFAHGRLVTKTVFPATLWKFGRSRDGRVPVEFCEVLTKDWLVKTSNRIDAERQRVLDCFTARGYQGLR
jgi:hypothetical protein